MKNRKRRRQRRGEYGEEEKIGKEKKNNDNR